MCGAAPRGEAGWLVGGGTQQWRHSAVAALSSGGTQRWRHSATVGSGPSGMRGFAKASC